MVYIQIVSCLFHKLKLPERWVSRLLHNLKKTICKHMAATHHKAQRGNTALGDVATEIVDLVLVWAMIMWLWVWERYVICSLPSSNIIFNLSKMYSLRTKWYFQCKHIDFWWVFCLLQFLFILMFQFFKFWLFKVAPES